MAEKSLNNMKQYNLRGIQAHRSCTRFQLKSESKFNFDHLKDQTIWKLFVTSFTKKTTERDLLKHFRKYGKVEECVIKQNKKNNFAFITFKDIESAHKALASENKLKKRPLLVMPADYCHQPNPVRKKTKDAKEKKEADKDATSLDSNDDSYPIIHKISDNCLMNIFRLLPIVDRVRVERVCRRWRDLSLNSWKTLRRLDVNSEAWGFRVPELGTLELYQVLKRCGRFITMITFFEETDTMPLRTVYVIGNFCPNLKIAYLGTLEVTPREIKFLLDHCSELEFLEMDCHHFRDDNFSRIFPTCGKLEYVSLQGAKIDGSCLLHLPKRTETVVLVDPKNGMNYSALRPAIRRLENLHNLYLSTKIDHFERRQSMNIDGIPVFDDSNIDNDSDDLIFNAYGDNHGDNYSNNEDDNDNDPEEEDGDDDNDPDDDFEDENPNDDSNNDNDPVDNFVNIEFDIPADYNFRYNLYNFEEFSHWCDLISLDALSCLSHDHPLATDNNENQNINVGEDERNLESPERNATELNSSTLKQEQLNFHQDEGSRGCENSSLIQKKNSSPDIGIEFIHKNSESTCPAQLYDEKSILNIDTLHSTSEISNSANQVTDHSSQKISSLKTEAAHCSYENFNSKTNITHSSHGNLDIKSKNNSTSTDGGSENQKICKAGPSTNEGIDTKKDGDTLTFERVPMSRDEIVTEFKDTNNKDGDEEESKFKLKFYSEEESEFDSDDDDYDNYDDFFDDQDDFDFGEYDYVNNLGLLMGSIESSSKNLRILQLNIYHPSLIPDFIDPISRLANFTNLERLDISSMLIVSDNCLRALGANCSKLNVLIINSCKRVTDLGIAGIALLPELKHLSMSDIPSIIGDPIACLSTLKTLYCARSRSLQEKGLKALISDSQELEQLDVQGCLLITNSLVNVAVSGTKKRSNNVKLKIFAKNSGINIKEVTNKSELLEIYFNRRCEEFDSFIDGDWGTEFTRNESECRLRDFRGITFEDDTTDASSDYIY